MRLVLVRHGQTPSNVAGLLDTAAPGPGLTDLGRRQAAAIPGAFRDHDIESIAVSPLTRTTLTATPLAEARTLELETLAGLSEVQAGDLEMRGEGEALHTYIATIFGWVRGDLGLRMPGGESGREFFDRYDAAIESLTESGADTVVAVSHGAAIRAWVASRAQGIDAVAIERSTMPNTGFVALDGDFRSGWKLVEWSQHPAGGHEFAAGPGPDPTAAAYAPGGGR